MIRHGFANARPSFSLPASREKFGVTEETVMRSCGKDDDT